MLPPRSSHLLLKYSMMFFNKIYRMCLFLHWQLQLTISEQLLVTDKLCTQRNPPQLFSIHAFVRSDSCIKQVPLMFVIMSGRRKRDYKNVLKAIKSLLPSCALKTITLDFEAAMWQAASDVFPNVKLLGCVFHWAQAVWHKIQAVGLQGAYTNDTSTHSYLSKLLSLPYLPHEHINLAFYQLAAQAVTPALQEIYNYMPRRANFPSMCLSSFCTRKL